MKHYIDLANLEINQGPSWLRKLKTSSLETFTKLGFPNRKNESWRFTNIDKFVQNNLTPIIDSTKKLTINETKITSHFENKLVFVNGILKSELSESKDIEIWPLESAFGEKFVKESLESFSHELNDPMISYNQAQLKSGVVIKISKDLESPLNLIYITSSDQNEVMNNTYNLLVIEDNIKAKIVETYFGEGKNIYMNNSITNVHIEEGACVEHAKIQVEAKNSLHVSTTRFILKEKAILKSFVLNLGAKTSRNNLNVELTQKESTAYVNGLYALSHDQHSDSHTSIDHKVEHTFSHQLYKGILDDSSKGVFNGQVIVRKDAQKVDSSQLNKNLLLSSKAHIDTQPELQIFADDVKCAHGATIGQISPEQIFYLESRGIKKPKAFEMLSTAFANDVVMKIEDTKINKYVADLVDDYFKGRNNAN